MVEFSKLKKLALDPQWGKMTSHEILARMQAFYTGEGGGRENKGLWSGGPSQMEIMQKLGMFTAHDFVWVTFEALHQKKYTVLTYTWADSPWEDIVDGLLKLPEEKCHGLSDGSPLWIDVFCLDQFHPEKMCTIMKSEDIYSCATYYYVIGLAIFDRVWCLAEICSVDDKKRVLVDEFKGFIERREKAYKVFKSESDPTFQDSKCAVETDREIVKTRIVGRFKDISNFDNKVKEISTSVLEPFRKVGVTCKLQSQSFLNRCVFLFLLKGRSGMRKKTDEFLLCLGGLLGGMYGPGL